MGHNFLKEYQDLESRVLVELRKKILESKTKSKYVDESAIKVNIFDYDEMVFINGRLTFLDKCGYHYDIYSECSLEDLINIYQTI